MDAVTQKPGFMRPAALVLVLCAELIAVSLFFDAYRPGLAQGGYWFGFLSNAGQFAKMLVAVLVFLVLGLWPRLPAYLDALQRSTGEYPFQYILATQLCSYGLFIWCTAAIFGANIAVADISDFVVMAWLVTLVATGGLWLLSVAPAHFWRRLVVSEPRVFAYAVIVGIAAWWLTLYAQSLWTPLSDLTFRLSAAILGLIYPDIIVDPDLKRLGAMTFVVNIAPQCSGYEGMALMAMFTGFYLSIFRKEFRFPQALLLFPIGIVTIWLFNNVRIALLIAIGASYSPAVAVGGFHSQAGWISFIAVIIVTLTLAYRTPFFSTVSVARKASVRGLNLPMATLLPFIVLLATTILTSAMSADFDWFYPMRVIGVGLAIAICWRLYGISTFKTGIEPWLAGAVAFALWIALVPADPVQNEVFASGLQGASQATAIAWLLFKTLGAVITVPLAEELLFRGYLLSRLARQQVMLAGRIEFAWLPFIASSVLFGLLHAEWLAGIAAGLVYTLVRYRGNSIMDAVIAHGFTNLLLTAYVLATGNWSLW
ncbi:MAG: exosortase E/protease, VPEID-CTERM system [Gammaproteobacteria bacterium]|nr:exosortase E/protease, VPEID-CTERM system [Gammaproteobacteria bacterium]MDH3535727.1 exosortase E/protease, VPEID-CTERM system [Gammaproteobacteria bacterium]